MALHLAPEVDGDFAALPAEVAGVALVTIADSPPPPGAQSGSRAGVRADHLARRTSRIGLAPTLHAAVTEPFHLATQPA
jgi:alkanesulfonate monooxygenase SsuD/methylene tetrahydromethanopterin reductase-like flavin-dependent oxidoreductase (luciferase family)